MSLPTSPQDQASKRKRLYYIHSFGCKANRYDGAVLEEQMAAAGFTPAGTPDEAGVVVINTCTVTASADRDARRLIARTKQVNPRCHLIVTGCLAERDPAYVEQLGAPDTVFGNRRKQSFADVLKNVDGFARDRDSIPEMKHGDVPSVLSFRGLTRGYLKIQDGCPGGCTYCIVPSVRGPSRSVPLDETLRRFRALLERGFKEIVLTGIHIGLYGERGGLLKLLRGLEALPFEFRVRLSSLECNEVDRDLLQFIADSGRIAPHLHLPLQSGSRSVLKAMGRRYEPLEYSRCVELAARLIPSVGIGADVIVGFPCEADVEFRDTFDLIKDLPVTYLHVFRFSPRPGTKAAGMKACAAPRIVSERAARLKQLGNQKNLEFRSRFVGKRLSALTLDQPRPTALTGNYVKVALEAPAMPNRLVAVKIARLQEHKTLGKVEECDESRDL